LPEPDPTPRCPHCSTPLSRFSLPEAGGWTDTYHLACFNDDCPYFRDGWAWMLERYGVKSSLRYRIDLQGRESPLPVWSAEAIRDRILGADVGRDTTAADANSADDPVGGGGDGI
jgi:hypothetical protein